MVSENSSSDIVIIGAGPTGSCAAWEAVQGDADVSVFEEHQVIGKPEHCSGLIALKGLEKLGINYKFSKPNVCLNYIQKAKIIGPNFKSVEIDRGSNSMGVIDRISLDRFLADRAKNLGCKYYLGHRVINIEYHQKNWLLRIKHIKEIKKHRARFLVSAEGVHARLSTSIGLPSPNKNWIFPALQYEAQNLEDLDHDCVELYFGQNYAPGFFGWVIPIDENSARIGIAISRKYAGKTRILMNKFTKKHPLLSKRFKKAHIVKSYGGFVPAAGPVKRTFHDNFIVAGDAAGQTKATTGGGVNIGGYCGRLAGITARNILTKEVSSSQNCRDYQLRWQSVFEPDLTLMMLIRRILSPLPDEAWNRIIKVAKDSDIGNSLKTSNIDLHGLDLIKFSLNPRVLIKSVSLVPQAAVSLLRGFFI
ncbi:MAG: geranylgeranyl reductase family protein [Candidatus Thorarchaeota archaeon]